MSPNRDLSAPHQRRPPQGGHQNKAPPVAVVEDVAPEEGPRCPPQVGACELELGEEEDEVEEQEDDASLREHVKVQVRRHFYVYPMFN